MSLSVHLRNAMHACVTYVSLFVVVYCVLSSNCVTVDRIYKELNRLSISKIELKPIIINGGLEDIIIISAPIIHSSTQYYISNPEGRTTPLNITSKVNNIYRTTEEFDEIVVTYTRGGLKIITPLSRHKIFNVNFGANYTDPIDTYADETKDLKPNDFVIGPIHESDHGNWVLSAYVKTNDGGYLELFEVITILITEYIPTVPTNPKLRSGDTFKLRFAYPIEDLESCEITAPRSTFDRFYDRSGSDLDCCGFIISNVTKADEGLWRIRGVGKIVYESTVYLEVKDFDKL